MNGAVDSPAKQQKSATVRFFQAFLNSIPHNELFGSEIFKQYHVHGRFGNIGLSLG